MARIVSWFSCGAASAVATALALNGWRRNGRQGEFVIACIAIPTEHADNERFSFDFSHIVDYPVLTLRSHEYWDTWDVYERRRFLVGPHGAQCTSLLKKAVRYEFQQVDDRQVFGFTEDERARAERFVRQNFDVRMLTPLLDYAIDKKTCFTILGLMGLTLPAMYRLGYKNNNCIGRVKGGAGYWNKIRRDFPDTFRRMACLERELGFSIIRRKGTPVFLDELSPTQGRYESEADMSCGVVCSLEGIG